MPTKVFGQLDVVTPYGHTSLGNLDYIVPPGLTHVLIPMSDIVSNEAHLSFDAIANGGSAVVSGSGVTSRHQWILGEHVSFVTINYLQPITGLPEGALIKKMVIRSPWSCNLDMVITKNDVGGNFFTGGMIKKMRVRREIQIGTFLDQREFGPVTTITQTLQLADSEINADADVIVFDFMGLENTHFTLEQFIEDYSTILLTLKQEGTNDLDTFQTVSSGVVTNTVFYNVSFHTGWTITVEYEDSPWTWELGNPPANRSAGPGDRLTFTSDPLDESPLDFTELETLTIELLDAEGNIVGPLIDIPLLYWIDIEPYYLSFEIPQGSWSSYNAQRFRIKMTGTQFGGSMTLQEMWAVYFYNAPGVYTLVPGRTHDSYYDRTDAETIATIDAKIPDPSGKTGYY